MNLMDLAADDDLVTIASYPFLHQADTVKALLEQEGIPVFLADVNTVGMDWFLGNAIGYIKVQVPRTQAERAIALLPQNVRHSPPAGADDSSAGLECLACGVPMSDEDAACPACGWTYDE
jgi:hypothetical protein